MRRSEIGHAYTFEIDRDLQKSKVAIVKASWTRGLAVHPVGMLHFLLFITAAIQSDHKIITPIATAAIFIALLLSFSTHLTATLLASLMSFLAALLTLIAFAIDIALFALVRHAMNGLDIGANTNTAPGSSLLHLFSRLARFPSAPSVEKLFLSIFG